MYICVFEVRRNGVGPNAFCCFSFVAGFVFAEPAAAECVQLGCQDRLLGGWCVFHAGAAC